MGITPFQLWQLAESNKPNEVRRVQAKNPIETIEYIVHTEVLLLDYSIVRRTEAAKRQIKERRVINDLKANHYPENFIKSVDQPNIAQAKARENPKAYASIPYVKGV